MGAGVPARRQDAGDGAARPHAHRLGGGTALAAAQGRAGSVGLRPGRPARRHHRQSVCAEQDHLFLLRRAHRRRRPHRRGARQTQRRQRPARRDQGHLPPGRAAVVGQSLWLPHRAGRRRQSVRHAGRTFHLSRRGAKPRQSSRQADPDRARRLGARRTIPSSAATAPSRRSGATATATNRGLRSIRHPASSGRSSTARAAATRSTSSARARITAGR